MSAVPPRRAALLALAVLLSGTLAGCLDLEAAQVPNRLLEGPGGNGWERNATRSQDEPVSASLGLTKVQTIFYQDRAASGRGYAGTMQVTTIRTLFTPTEESLRDQLEERVRNAAEGAGIRIEGAAVDGARKVGTGAPSVFFLYNGTVTDPSGPLFTRNAKVKLLGEVWQCRAERTSVVVVALAQVTSGRSVGTIPLSNNYDATTWEEIVADPRGSIDRVRGDRGLAASIECG